MEIKEINNKGVWESFIAGCEEKTFLHSWNWGEFQKMLGKKVWRFGVFGEGQIISIILVLKIKAKRGTFLFIPHGPLLIPIRGNSKQYENSSLRQGFDGQSKFKILNILINKLKQLVKSEKASFIRIAPAWKKTEENNKIFKDLGFRNAPIHMHPELTWELDISPSEDELLMNMRKTTRYLIRQAEKNPNIEIIKSQSIKDVKSFNQLYQETVKRHNFVPFSLEYLKNEFSAFDRDGQILIFLGKYKGEIISSAMVIYYSNIGYYHQGASSRKYAKIPVSYLIQWEAIKEAKTRGCKAYNFWGIAPTDDKNPRRNPFGILRGRHPWYGLSLFKKGFGGYRKEYIKTQDLALSKKYLLTNIFEKIRKRKRNL